MWDAFFQKIVSFDWGQWFFDIVTGLLQNFFGGGAG